MTRGRDSVSVVTFITMGIASGRGPGGQAGTEARRAMSTLPKKRYLSSVYREQMLVDRSLENKISILSSHDHDSTIHYIHYHDSKIPFNAEKR